ncbi:MAG: hypothetical protein IPN32_25750 [Deltaproteobacteria bacterium]|nr:hypothetical protein [Deltaproteobacteria bacterium]
MLALGFSVVSFLALESAFAVADPSVAPPPWSACAGGGGPNRGAGPASASAPAPASPDPAAAVTAPSLGATGLEAAPAGTMRDPFRPEQPAPGWDTPAATTQSVTTTTPSNTTTTTTTVVVTQRVAVPPLPPAAPVETPRHRPFVGGYGGFGWRLGGASHRAASFTNVRGGLLLGERFSIGGSFVRMTKRFGPPLRGTSGKTYDLAMAYGGVQIGVAVIRRGRFELGIDSLLGVGVGCISRKGSRHDSNVDARCVERVKMFVAEPGAFMHFALTKWMRLGLNGGYRFVARERWASGSQIAMSGGYVGMNVDFGWFARHDWR